MTLSMKVEAFLGDSVTGKSLGTADVELARGRNELEVSGPGMRTLWNMIGKVQPNGVGNVEFSLVANGIEFQACRIVGMGGVMRISFLRERDL